MQQEATASTTKPRMKVVTVTPGKAERWLRKNKVNRRLRQSLVDKYGRDMKAGRWDLNGHTIKFSASGDLMDGQHRLYGCIKFDTPFETAVAYELPVKAMRNIDTGGMRSFADRLKLEGLDKQHTMVAAVTRLAYRYRVADTNSVTYEELSQVYNKYSRSIQDSVETVTGFVRRGDPQCLHATAVAFVHMLTKGKDRDKADNYAHQLVSGEGLSRSEPAHSIRARVLKARTEHMKIKSESQIAMMLRGWNALRERRGLKRVFIAGRTGDVGWKDIVVK